MMFARVLLASALALSPGLAAADTWAVATVCSHHFTDEKFNQHNYGIGFEIPTRVDRLAIIGGVYDNSMERASAYAGIAWTPIKLGAVHLGLQAGGFTGYGPKVTPALLPTAQLEVGRVGLNLTFVPTLPAVLGFQVKFAFR